MNSLKISARIGCRYIIIIVMGMCFSDDKSTSGIKKIDEGQRCKREPKAAELIIDINPQNVPETQADLLSPCPTIISLTSSAYSHSKAKSMISLEEALMNENAEIEENEEIGNLTSWMESHNTPSSLMKMTKSKIANPQKPQLSRSTAKSMINQLENCDNMSAALHVNNRVSSIVFSSVNLDIQFVLPKGRAGPLIVPYICYEKYSPKNRHS